ncbi:MAG: ABC transporter substrate-binding protein [Anaerolineae bacterium]|jgi:sn-glycerol 3-phosphate transport system substrate-binding protein|nr:ABC transporter substrate-binding protein [Anaerolineae bacterium]
MKPLRLFFILVALCAVALAPTSAQDTVTIRMVHIFGGENDDRGGLIQAVADEFMAANPGVVVEVSSPSTDYVELFNGALLAADQGQAPTIVQVEEGLTQLAADSGFFVPVGAVASEEQIASLDDLLPVLREYYSIGGELYSVPWNSSNPLLYYNKGMFEAAGLDPETPPADFEEILTACVAIMAAPEPPSACINFPMASWFPEQWVAMQNGLIADNDNGRTARATSVFYDSPEMLRVAEWYDVMDDLGYFTYSGTPNDYNGEGIAFLSGNTAMTINSTAGLALFQRFSGLQGIDLGIAPLFTPGPDATNGVTVGGASLWVTAGHSDAETQAGVDFIFFLTQTENDMRWHQGTGYFPTRQTSIDALTEEGWFEENPAYGIAVTQLQASAGNIANAGAILGPSAEVRGVLVEALQSIVDGDSTPAEALAAAKERADAILADYNSVVE